MRRQLVFLGCSLLVAVGTMHAMAETLDDVRVLFQDPPREYTSGPLWTWNDMLTEEQIVSTLEDLAAQGVKQAFVHPRPGLMTPYLLEDWFRLWKKSLETAERLDMNIWIYDENSYPSGFAGGYVPEAMPESRAQGIVMEESATAPAWADNVLGVYTIADSGVTNVSASVREGQTLPEGKYLIARVELMKPSPWYGDWWYVDLLRPGVTEQFIEITLGAYQREVGDQFGKRLPGWFTDEPHLKPVGQFHWTPDLAEQFENRWGYDLLDHLPSLAQPIGDWKRVRHNYYQVLNDLFVERWARPCYEYCEEHELEFTGHYWEHEWPNCTTIPDNMAMYAWHQRPAIDTLFNRYGEDVRAQFGNTRAVLELASVANQLGRDRTLCEAYGGSGWDLRFEDMKRIGDWLLVLGVNTIDEHLSRVSMRGVRKADYPPSFSYHAPWWDSYHVVSKYFARLSAAMSRGEQINKVLIIEPTTTAWMYQGDPAEPRTKLGDTFQKFVVDLAQAQVEFDIGSENIIADHGKVEGAALVVGERTYTTVVIPPLTENLNSATLDLLEKFVSARGVLYSCAAEPIAFVDGEASDRGTKLADQPLWRKSDPKTLMNTLLRAQEAEGISIRRAGGDKGILYHQCRQFDDGQLILLVNTSIDEPTHGVVGNLRGAVSRLDLETGAVEPRFADQGNYVFEIPPAGSLLLEVRENVDPYPPTTESGPGNALSPTGTMSIRRETPNALVLDYLDLSVNGNERSKIYYHPAAEIAFQEHGLPNNPWFHAVQFRDALISKTFPEDSGFTATYRYTIDGTVPADLRAVIERPDLYAVTCNGEPVTATPGEWWFDKQFGVIDVSNQSKPGENVLTIVAKPFTMFHELAAAYILGDFSLRPVESGFVIVAPQALTTAPWNEQGMPVYGDAVVYSQQFDVERPASRYRVELSEWYGSVAEVLVNGESAGHIWHQPWQCEVTGVKAGVNTVEVRVTGTPKNTFGPHHGNAGLGLAGPHNFRDAPESGPPAGESYQTIGYGLFAPFVVRPL